MPYTKTEGTFPSTGGEFTVHYYIYTPDCPPRAILQISHGMCEYIGRYEAFADYLCTNGILVCGSDHIGHGASINSTEDFGYFGKKHGDRTLAADIHELNRIMRGKYRHLPYILFGHSMGSFVCRDYLTRFGDTLDGAVICGTAGPNKQIKTAIAIAATLVRTRGKRFRSRMLRELAFKGYDLHFPGEGKEAWLTRDKEIQEKYRCDPLCTFSFTAAGYRDMFRLLARVSTPDWAKAVPTALPVLLTSGEDDPVGGYGKGVGEVRAMLEEVELCNLTVQMYPDCRHELINETNRAVIWAQLLAWIDSVIEGVLECRTM